MGVICASDTAQGASGWERGSCMRAEESVRVSQEVCHVRLTDMFCGRWARQPTWTKEKHPLCGTMDVIVAVAHDIYPSTLSRQLQQDAIHHISRFLQPTARKISSSDKARPVTGRALQRRTGTCSSPPPRRGNGQIDASTQVPLQGGRRKITPH